jgi:hypothetical protein
MAAAEGMFDESRPATVARHDANQDRLGNIGEHKVRHCLLTKRRIWDIIGASRGMQSNFPSIRLGLMVGIGGGVPMLPSYDIRLGDAVEGRPISTNDGVICEGLPGVCSTIWLPMPQDKRAKEEGKRGQQARLNRPERGVASGYAEDGIPG